MIQYENCCFRYTYHEAQRDDGWSGVAMGRSEAKAECEALFFGVESMRVSFSLPKLIKSNDMYKSLKEKKKRSNFNEKKS